MDSGMKLFKFLSLISNFQHRIFWIFLADLCREYCDPLVHNNVRWLSKGNVWSGLLISDIKSRNFLFCQSQWSRGLRRRSAAERLLVSWIRIPPGAWMFGSCECCVLSGRGLCDGPIPRPEESCRLWCVFECSQVKIENRRGKDYETKQISRSFFSQNATKFKPLHQVHGLMADACYLCAMFPQPGCVEWATKRRS
jgi:hypothetical protein